MKFQPLVKMGDQLMWFKYVIKNVAKETTRPLPSCPNPCLPTTGRVCTSCQLVEGRQPLFAGDKYAGLSQQALYAAAGF